MSRVRGRRSRAVVLLSGGMDSGTCLAQALEDGHSVTALTVEYGQRHRREIAAARGLAHYFRVRRHLLLRLPLGSVLASSLTNRRRRLPRRSSARTIPSTYVPARNTILLAIALGVAESERASAIYFGANAIDYSGYPDCRPEFLREFGRLARLATKRGVDHGWAPKIVAPLLRMSKAQIVRRGERLGVPWELTWSCYTGGSRPCGWCDACRLRALGFADAGRLDPLRTR